MLGYRAPGGGGSSALYYKSARRQSHDILFRPRVRKEKKGGGDMPLRMRVHEREPIGLALRRFKKLLERSGIQKELRKRKYYEKPCEARRRAQLRKQSAIRKAETMGTRTK